MNIFILLIFITVVIVSGSSVFFIYTALQKDLNRNDQMSLFPLEEDEESRVSVSNVIP